MEDVSLDLKKTMSFFEEFDKGKGKPTSQKFSGLSLKNRSAHEMICDCCSGESGDGDCCGFN